MKPSVFLDSGAYSAFTKKIKIDIDEYITFIKRYEKYLEVYSVLDDINDPVVTYQNQKYMEKQGLKPLPCFHYGEDIYFLKKYLKDDYKYLALGGMVPVSNPNLKIWLNNLFLNYLTNKEGYPIIKVHGFGLTGVDLLVRYPWYSVDSTSWVMTGRFGAVFVPIFRNGKYDYEKTPHKVTVSDKSPKQKQEGQHYNTFNSAVQKQIDFYFTTKGYLFKELSEDYKKRDELNIIYFLDLEKNLPDKPFNRRMVKKGFF